MTLVFLDGELRSMSAMVSFRCGSDDTWRDGRWTPTKGLPLVRFRQDDHRLIVLDVLPRPGELREREVLGVREAHAAVLPDQLRQGYPDCHDRQRGYPEELQVLAEVAQ